MDALWRNSIDYAQIMKEYSGATGDEARKYSPATCTSIQKNVVAGNRT